jgi:hypothetical protein
MQGSDCKLPLRTRGDGRHCRGRAWSLAAGLLTLPAIALLIPLSIRDAALAVEAIAPIVLELDRATLVRMPPKQRSIVLDDPNIAHATYLSDSNQVVLTGISYGETKITVFDEAGEVLATSKILVREAADAGITIYRGHERLTYYDCDRRCQPRLQLGDADRQFADIGEQMRSREGKPAEARTESGGHL